MNGFKVHAVADAVVVFSNDDVVKALAGPELKQSSSLSGLVQTSLSQGYPGC